jgi:hypothetical protein
VRFQRGAVWPIQSLVREGPGALFPAAGGGDGSAEAWSWPLSLHPVPRSGGMFGYLSACPAYFCSWYGAQTTMPLIQTYKEYREFCRQRSRKLNLCVDGRSVLLYRQSPLSQKDSLRRFRLLRQHNVGQPTTSWPARLLLRIGSAAFSVITPYCFYYSLCSLPPIN